MRRIVLIADSNPDDRASLNQALSRYDVEVRYADRDDSAHDVFLECGPVLVFIDLLLPRKGGLELLRRIRSTQEGRGTPVLMMSPVKGTSDLRSEAVDNLGAVGLFEKPLKIDRLREVLDKHLAQPQCGLLEVPFSLPTLPDSGDLQDLPFAILCKGLVDHSYSGLVHLAQGQTRKILYFQDGDLTFTSSNRVTETLGRHMLHRELFSEETYRAALDTMTASRGKFGAILVEMGAVKPEIIDRAVQDNVVEKTLDLFGWMSGQFSLAPYNAPPAPLPFGPVPGRELLYRGIMGKMVFGEILALLRPRLNLFLTTVRDPERLLVEFPETESFRPLLQAARNFSGKTLHETLSLTGGESEGRLLICLILLGYFAFTDCADTLFDIEGEDLTTLQQLYLTKRLLDDMRHKNYFRVLGVPLDATDADVHAAYLEKAKELHPDKAGASNGTELSQMLSEAFVIVRSAYESLGSAEKRRAYLAALTRGSEQDTSGPKILEAETLYQRGMAELRKRKWQAALPSLREAYRLNSNEAEYALNLGIALMSAEEGDRQQNTEEARAMFRRANELDPSSSEAYYRLGLLSKRDNDAAKAANYFQLALMRNPRHVEAQRELRLLRSRGAGGSVKSVFGSLMGRKPK